MNLQKNGEFHGKKLSMNDKREVEIPKGERLVSTLVSLRYKQGDCLGEFYSKAIWRAFLRVDELCAIFNLSSQWPVSPRFGEIIIEPTFLGVSRGVSGKHFQLLLLIHPEERPQDLHTTLSSLPLSQDSYTIGNKRQ